MFDMKVLIYIAFNLLNENYFQLTIKLYTTPFYV